MVQLLICAASRLAKKTVYRNRPTAMRRLPERRNSVQAPMRRLGDNDRKPDCLNIMDTSPSSWLDILGPQLERHAHLPHSRFVQVATVRENGRPANRTLAFRFFVKNGHLLFTADTRTEKIAQLAANPWAEACWYFTESRMQVRVLGTMQLVAETEDEELRLARLRTWKERSEESRQSFTWPHAGQPLSSPGNFTKVVPELPPENFALLILAPERVDILDLALAPHSRIAHVLANGAWHVEAINP